ncbi:hypothetical protein BT63DRAFT_414579 [Microthyrium microscopicum]|uniref:Uncharacterized protein n=1 Tax=Microthyrium microscopicum TaxID=703497 RepID=A0A6A6U8U4_9PEZI|nr:hypothetical protein BT63DRAFT_414579 [Microthyrium microscopicum]
MVNADKLQPPYMRGTASEPHMLRDAWIVDLTDKFAGPQQRVLMYHQIPPQSRFRPWFSGQHSYETVIEICEDIPKAPRWLIWYVNNVNQYMAVRTVIGVEATIVSEYTDLHFDINTRILATLVADHGTILARLMSYIENCLYYGHIQSIKVERIAAYHSDKYTVKLVCLPKRRYKVSVTGTATSSKAREVSELSEEDFKGFGLTSLSDFNEEMLKADKGNSPPNRLITVSQETAQPSSRPEFNLPTFANLTFRPAKPSPRNQSRAAPYQRPKTKKKSVSRSNKSIDEDNEEI